MFGAISEIVGNSILVPSENPVKRFFKMLVFYMYVD